MKKVAFLVLALTLLSSMVSISVFADDSGGSRVDGAISIEKTADKPRYEVGETLKYTLTITNIGQTNLTDIKVIDTFSGDIEKISIEELPASVTYAGTGQFNISELKSYTSIQITYSYIATDTDIGTLENTSTVEAIPEGGTEKDKTDDEAAVSVSVEQKKTPMLSVKKSLTCIGADTGAVSGGLPTRSAKIDETICWSVTITNEGDAAGTVMLIDTLSENREVHIIDEADSPIDNGSKITVAANSTRIFTVYYKVLDTDAGAIIHNTIVLEDNDNDPSNNLTAESASVTVEVPKVSNIDIEALVDKTDVTAEEKLDFKLQITNTGETKLKNIKITDVFSGNLERIEIGELPAGTVYNGAGQFDIGDLDINSRITITFSYVTVSSDMGVLTNTATIEAIPEGGSEKEKVSDHDFVSVIVKEKAKSEISAISIDKTVDKVYAQVGETLYYALHVKNIGETSLTNVEIVDIFGGDIQHIQVGELPANIAYVGNGQFEVGELEIQESVTIPYSYVLKKRDVGTLLNTAVAEGIPAGGAETDKVSDEDSSDPVTINEEEQPIHPTGPKPQLGQTGDHLSYIIGYPDGTVQPLGTITRAEVATIFFRLLTDESRAYYWSQTNTFSDVAATDWFNNAVSTMAAAGIINGYPDGTFGPQNPVTRAEFAAITTRFTEQGRDGVSQSHFKQYFKDVDKSDWYAAAVELAYELGWAQGYEGDYRPEDDMTRAEIMTMINRILERETRAKDMLPDMVFWPDNQPDAWYYEAIQEATNSHAYNRTTKKVPNLTFNYETWLELIDNPVWNTLEQEWSVSNSQN